MGVAAVGYEAEQVIIIGLRGAPDSLIVARLNSEDELFLTPDQEFLSRPVDALAGPSSPA